MNRPVRRGPDPEKSFLAFALTAIVIYLAMLGLAAWAVIELVLWVTSK